MMGSCRSIFLISLIVAAGCAPASMRSGDSAETTVNALTGSEWTLTNFGPEDNPIPVLPGVRVTARFEGDQLLGSAGCNSYSTPYASTGSSVSFGPIAATEMACPGSGVMTQEAAFLAALATTSAYGLDDLGLSLAYDGGILRFVRGLPSELAALADSSWVLEMLEQIDDRSITGMGLPEGMDVTVYFAQDQLRASTGCNEFGAPYQLDGNRLSIGPMVKSESICPKATQIAVEALVLGGLQSAYSYSADANRLTISHPDGNLIFRAGPEQDASLPTPLSVRVQPPAASLAVGGNVRSAGIGTYCWSEADGDEMLHLCVDTAGIATHTEPLQISASTFSVLLTLPLTDVPSHLTMSRFPVSIGDEQESRAGGNRWWDPPSDITEETTLPLTSRQEIELELQPGLHVIQVTAWWDGIGDVVYGFLVEVLPPMTPEARQAQDTLIAFFEHLRNGRYAQATALYGGDFEAMMAHNPDLDVNDHAGLLERACTVNGAICLGVEAAIFTEQITSDTYQFLVSFVSADGTKFAVELPEKPSQTQFLFRVAMLESGGFGVISPLAYGP